MDICKIFFVFLFLFTASSSIFADSPSLDIDTMLTDRYTPGNPGDPKDVFDKDTFEIYVIWKSDKLKEGQKIKSVWVADDTNSIAPPHYKINEAQMTLEDGIKGKVLSNLPGSYWDGKFSLSRPNAGWPVGRYHVEIYVDDQLVKSVPFVVNAANPIVAAINTKMKGAWGAIAVDIASHDPDDCAYGIGGGNSKNEAIQNAVHYCDNAQGSRCKVVITYKQCGAYALSKEGRGSGVGVNKEDAEAHAIKACRMQDCQVIISDCN